MTYPFQPLLSDPPDLDGKIVLITGGTGSFGRAFARRLLDSFNPRKVIIFSRDEQKHYAMQADMDDPRLRFLVGDIRDRSRLLRAFAGVDVVVHAAAMKHVHLSEYNPIEAIRTNVDGAANVIDAALERGVQRVIALSSDKAVSPINLYGATKLCMEKLFIAANSYTGDRDVRFDLVRYGNVVGSKGSVVPLFIKQREEGRLTITEGSMTRFWIGMDRAIDLVLLALQAGLGGEVFVPRLPACTVDVLSKAVAPDLPIDQIGIRPGEKIHESLITSDESHNAVEFDNYFVIKPAYAPWGGPGRTDGKPVTERFSYSSDLTYALSVAETRDLLRETGFIK